MRGEKLNSLISKDYLWKNRNLQQASNRSRESAGSSYLFDAIHLYFSIIKPTIRIHNIKHPNLTFFQLSPSEQIYFHIQQIFFMYKNIFSYIFSVSTSSPLISCHKLVWPLFTVRTVEESHQQAWPKLNFLW